MPSRRRTANKNLSNNLAEVQRRLRTLERRPTRSKLGNRSVTGTAIGPNSVDGTQVSFGINLVAQTDPVTGDPIAILNPQDGQQVFDPYSGVTNTYSEEYNTYIETSATDLTAQSLALNAQASADGKNTIYRQSSAPTGGTYVVGDIWFDESNDGKINRWTVTSGTGAWSAFTLGDKAIGNINASHINAGTIDASVIRVSNLDASRITTGTLTGRTVQTSDSGVRLEMSSQDELRFYNANGEITGQLSPFKFDGTTASYGLALQTPSFGPYVYLDDTILDLSGTGASANSFAGIAIHSEPIFDTQVSIYATDPDGGGIKLSADNNVQIIVSQPNYLSQWIMVDATGISLSSDVVISISGPMAWSNSLLAGTGAPTTDGTILGEVVFRYT